MEMSFHKNVKENDKFNQYWYSKITVESIIKELFSVAKSHSRVLNVAFLSTPSLFFSVDSVWKGEVSEMPINPVLFDFDKSLSKGVENRFQFYDFQKPLNLPERLSKTFDCVVVDPPFITEEVWRCYAKTSEFLLRGSCKSENSFIENNCGSSGLGLFIGTSIYENSALLEDLFGASCTKFLPSIPTLVYQYNLFTNFDPLGPLASPNPEIS